MKREMRLATIKGPSSKYHFHLIDEEGKEHWIIRGQFDPGAKSATGAQVTIEHRPPVGWYVLGKKRRVLPAIVEVAATAKPVRDSRGKYVYPPGMTADEKRKFRAEARKKK